MNSPETWKTVSGYEGLYEVSDLGQVRSLDHRARVGNGTRSVKGRILKIYRHPDRRSSVNLSKGDHQATMLIHRLVLYAFVGDRPTGAEGCHGNGDAADNRLSNLRWDTHPANEQDKIRHGNNININKTHCPRAHLLVEPNLKPAQLA